LTAEPLLEVKNLEAGYEAPVVGPVSFRMEAGETLGLVGPNGSGKTTLLKAIAGHAHVFAGAVVRRPELTLAWIDQQPRRLAEMPFDGWEYLRYAEADAEEPPPRLARWLDQRIDSLSGGQFQLLACWSVLGTAAEFLMLDEPTSNLDVDSERALIEILERERGRRGILLVSHDRKFLQQVCDRTLDVGT
jgi:ATPase subunit of ABC transporter with duplicated ATPase domains